MNQLIIPMMGGMGGLLFLFLVAMVLAVALLICGGKRKRWKLVWGAALAEFLLGLWVLNEFFFYGGYLDAITTLALFLIPLISIVCLVLVFQKPRTTSPQDGAAAPEAAPAVSIPVGEDEQVVLTRTVPCVAGYLLLGLGILGLLAVLVMGADSNLDFDEMLPALLPGIVCIVVGLILKSLVGHLTVTTKRVHFVGPFARRINLPLGQISSVSTALFGTLRIASSSGWIWLSFVPGYVEVYDTVNELLNQQK